MPNRQAHMSTETIVATTKVRSARIRGGMSGSRTCLSTGISAAHEPIVTTSRHTMSGWLHG